MTLTSNVELFLDALPVEAPRNEALRWIVGIANKVATVLQVSEPSAFQQDVLEAPEALAEVFELLEPSDCTPDLLGLAWEQLLATSDRRAKGAHFTPSEVADRVVGLALDDLEVAGGTPKLLWDPTAGGGAFLLAAARAIEKRTGALRGEIVSSMWATDIDETALKVCDAALEMWALGAGRPTIYLANSLLDLPAHWPDDFSLIVGNPPFLGQLTADTARSADQQALLKERYGDLAAGYVDHSSLFVELGLRHLGSTSVLALILPQSFLGALSSAGVRNGVIRSGSLKTLWVDDANSFAASVEVIALVVVSAPREGDSGSDHWTKVVVGMSEGQAYPMPPAESWAPLLARSQGVPPVTVHSSNVALADIAIVTAGFRQHFYGIQTAVGEPAPAGDACSHTAAQLMTSGSIDPFAPRWGHKPIKFAGDRWEQPWLYIDRIEDPDVQRWFLDRLVPKVLVASQTPVIEAVVDPKGTMVPSVPVITVEPRDTRMVWHIAAAISSPTTCALMLEDAAGTGLSAGAIRVSARNLSEVLLPEPGSDWDAGASSAMAAQAAWLANDVDAYEEAIWALGEAMTAAYGGAEDLVDWWASRLPGRRK